MCTVLLKKSTATYTGERKLFADKFTNYSSEVRPRIDPTQNVTVTVVLGLKHIKRLVLYCHLIYMRFVLVVAGSL